MAGLTVVPQLKKLGLLPVLYLPFLKVAAIRWMCGPRFLFWQRAAEHRFKAVVANQDGSLYALGHSPFDTGRDMSLVRITEHGKLDEGFGTRGVVRLGRHRTFGEDVALDAQSRVVATGYFYTKGGTRSLVARVTKTGKLDPKFGRAGLVVHNSGSDNRAQQLHVRANGSLLISGYHAATQNQVFCLQDNDAPCAGYGKGGVAVVTVLPGHGAFATREGSSIPASDAMAWLFLWTGTTSCMHWCRWTADRSSAPAFVTSATVRNRSSCCLRRQAKSSGLLG